MTGRRNTFDFLRLLAALAVVVQHATVHLDARFLWVSPGNPWWMYDGVTAFFIISGYFVFRSADRLHSAAGGWRDFYVNRALRIVPAIWTYVLVVTIVVLGLGAADLSDLINLDGLVWVVTGLALVPVYSPIFLEDFGTGTINGSLWTIPVEVTFYVVVPVLVLLAQRLGRPAFLMLLLPSGAVMALASIPLRGTVGDLYGLTFGPHLWAFAVGIAWYLTRDRVGLHWVGAVGGLLAYALVRIVSHAGRASDWIPTVSSLLGVVALSYVVMFVGFRGPQWFRSVSDRIGDLSFGTYIWHMVIVNVFLALGIDDRLPGTLAVSLVIIAALVLAWMSWRLVERPALARKRRTTRRRAWEGHSLTEAK